MFSLAVAVRTVVFKDSQPFRQSMFRYLSGHKRSVRAVLSAHRLLGTSWLSTLMVGAYGLKSAMAVRPPAGRPAIWAAHLYRNERRQLEAVSELSEAPVGYVDFGAAGIATLASWRWLLAGVPREAGFYLRLVHRLNQGGDFLVVARAAETAAFYLRFVPLLRDSGARAVLVSSDSNPYAMGLTFAARSLGIKTIYVTHGHLPEGPPRIYFDLSIMDGPAVVDTYERSRGLEGRVVFRGSEGTLRPMRTAGLRAGPIRVGYFASILVDWEETSALLARVKARLGPSAFLVRLHPNKTIRHPAAEGHLRRIGVEVSDGDRVLLEDAERCDLVLAGNSSCHLSVLKFGVPTLYMRGLDAEPYDFYKFIELGIIPEASPDDLDTGRIAAFYEDPEWTARFARFDASYPDKDLSGDVANAISEVLE